MECADALRANKVVTEYVESPEYAECFTRLCMVAKFNSVTITPVAADVSGQGIYYGHGLLEVACRMVFLSGMVARRLCE